MRAGGTQAEQTFRRKHEDGAHRARQAIREWHLQSERHKYEKPPTKLLIEAEESMPRNLPAHGLVRDCGAGGNSSCFFAALLGCQEGEGGAVVVVPPAQLAYARKVFFKFMRAIGAADVDLVEGEEESAEERRLRAEAEAQGKAVPPRVRRSLCHPSAWAAETHLDIASVFMGAAINYWHETSAPGAVAQPKVNCTFDWNWTGRRTEGEDGGARHECYLHCCPTAQYRYGQQVDTAHSLTLRTPPPGRPDEPEELREDHAIAADMMRRQNELMQFDQSLSINMVLQTSSAGRGDIRGHHFVMFTPRPPSVIQTPDTSLARIAYVEGWLQKNSKPLLLFQQCLQILYPRWFPERNQHAPHEEVRGNNIRNVCLNIAARDLFRDWNDHHTNPRADVFPLIFHTGVDAQQDGWYWAFRRVKELWQDPRKKSAINDWAATQADLADRADRKRRRGEAPDDEPVAERRHPDCRAVQTDAGRRACYNCRAIIVANAAVFPYHKTQAHIPAVPLCNVQAFFNSAAAQRAGLHWYIPGAENVFLPAPGHPTPLEGWFADAPGTPLERPLLHVPLSVTVRLGSGRILTAGWQPASPSVRDKTIGDLLRAKYRRVPSAYWRGMGLLAQGAARENPPEYLSTRPLARVHFEDGEKNFALVPTKVGCREGARVVWHEPQPGATLRTLAETCGLNRDGTAARLSLTSNGPLLPWDTDAAEGLGQVLEAVPIAEAPLAAAGTPLADADQGPPTPVGGIATPVGGLATPVGGIATPVGGLETPLAHGDLVSATPIKRKSSRASSARRSPEHRRRRTGSPEVLDAVPAPSTPRSPKSPKLSERRRSGSSLVEAATAAKRRKPEASQGGPVSAPSSPAPTEAASLEEIEQRIHGGAARSGSRGSPRRSRSSSRTRRKSPSFMPTHLNTPVDDMDDIPSLAPTELDSSEADGAGSEEADADTAPHAAPGQLLSAHRRARS